MAGVLDLVQSIGGMAQGTWKALLPLSSASVCTLQTGCPFSQQVCGRWPLPTAGRACIRQRHCSWFAFSGRAFMVQFGQTPTLSQSVGHPRGEEGGVLSNTPVVGLGRRAAEGRGEAVGSV